MAALDAAAGAGGGDGDEAGVGDSGDGVGTGSGAGVTPNRHIEAPVTTTTKHANDTTARMRRLSQPDWGRRPFDSG
jgi:hypothetical protein